MNIDLDIPSVNIEPISVVDYPSAGTGELVGCGNAGAINVTKVVALNAFSSSSSNGPESFSRVDSFSSCKMPDNSAIIAVASQDNGVENLPPTLDPYELAARQSSRVHLISSQMGSNYAAAVRRCVIVSVEVEPAGDCKQGVVDVRVDVGSDIWSDTNIDSVWPLDGDLANIKFKIISRIAPDLWRILPSDQRVTIDLAVGRCFRFIAYGSNHYKYPNSLNSISPLPYIEVDGLPVPAQNPQVASNAFATPSQSPYVYVIAEAPVNGTNQLFFYSLKIDTNYEMFGWRQLTFDGENRNAKVKCDSFGNIHIVWESSRCKTSQVFYGMIGPSSRASMNETFVTAVDKQIAAGIFGGADLSIVAITNPLALDLRDINDYGVPSEASAWSIFTANSGTATVISESAISVAGNPKTQKFSAFATLERDEFNKMFNGDFSQLSYQTSFDLILAAPNDNYATVDDIREAYLLFQQTFAPYKASTINVNVFLKSGKLYTIDDPQTVYENIIPIAGSYKAKDLAYGPSEQIALRHYMLVAIPEKVRFTAKSTQGFADIRQEHYTGYFKLGLVFETAANLSESTNVSQKHHWIRLFGPRIQFGVKNNYKIAVHYSHLRQEGLERRADEQLFSVNDQSVRFSGDIIVAVNNIPVVGETFIPDFSDNYNRFDIGLGCATVGEFRTLLLSSYDGSTNDNLAVTMTFTRVVVGPHSMKADPYLTAFAATDRNVSRMVIASDATFASSLLAADEAWDTNDNYLLTLGLNRQKFALSQVPITFNGKNTCPSLALDNCGQPHIAFQSLRENDWEIYYTSAINASIPFRFDTRITESFGNSINPSIAVDNEGRRLIAWHDNRNGVYQIYAARSVANIGCEQGACEIATLRYYGFENSEYSGFEVYDPYDPYIDAPYYASICQFTFKFKNTSGSTKKYHFRANFFSDSSFTSLHKDADSRLDISQWSYFIGGDQIQMPYDGISIANGGTVEVAYNPTEDDDVFGAVYYVEVEADDGATIKPLEDTAFYFCPAEQRPKCTVPVVYSNNSGSSKTIHFRTTVYRDSAMTQVVLSAASENDITRWTQGHLSFPAAGISVTNGSTISVVYNPEFLSLAQSQSRDSSVITGLLCGVKYWVQTEYGIATAGHVSSYSPLDTFAIMCSCKNLQTFVWREDKQSSLWHCSGQGGQDIRLTATASHALFPSASASDDGIIYIAWEDRRFAPNQNANNHYIYYGIWDARSDEFFTSAQGFRDREVSTFSRYSPQVIVNNMQHATFIFSDGRVMYTRTCSLFQPTAQSSSSSSYTGAMGVFNETPLALTLDDAANCLLARVFRDDVVEFYHKDSNTPIAMVESCKIRFEVAGPPGAYGVRFKNEDETSWSEWLNIVPKLQNWPSSSSSGERGYFDGFFIGTDRFLVPWVLSRRSGNKTVSCQILTHNGVSPVFSVDIVARYKDLKHKIEFFRDSALTKPASSYKGTPVISLNVLTIDANDSSTIVSAEVTNPIIYLKITFEDAKSLDSMLEVARLAKYGGDNHLTFDIYTQGFNKFSLPLTKTSDGVYVGNFTISEDDGIDNKDGSAVISVNIPTPCTGLRSSSSATCLQNLIKPSDIKLLRAAEVQDAVVNLQKFKYNYSKDIQCKFTSNACVDGSEVFTVTESDDDIAVDSPTFLGPVSCLEIGWNSPRKGEKGFFSANGGVNASDWVVYSPTFELDFSDSRIDYLRFDSTSTLDDILFMLRPNDAIVTSGTSTITFSVPQGSVLFADTDGYYCHKSSNCNQGSVHKLFNVAGESIGDVPTGTLGTDGTGHIGTCFTLPSALGYNDDGFLSSSSAGSTNVLRTDFNISVSKTELQRRGFITGNGKLRFRLAHIPSGVGFAKVVGMTCGSACGFNLSSSSSSSS